MLWGTAEMHVFPKQPEKRQVAMLGDMRLA